MSTMTTLGVARLADIVLAGACLVLVCPLMLMITIAIKLESSGPIFFAQTRLGRGGHRFQMYKFRKFRADVGRGLPLTLHNDSRMTKVGSVLARTKLDELPQLYNILRGDMAVVGPRPESFDFADCFVGYHRRLLDYKPGVFGPSQVAFRNEATYFPPTDQVRFYREVLFPLKANRDLAYYPHRTLTSDMLWIVRGVMAVVGWGHGATVVTGQWRERQPTP